MSAASDNDAAAARLDDMAAGAAEESGRHATNLELFLDLVFVFAVTQVAGGPGR